MDRAALEWALANHVSHGGWCPRGRKAEDGIIPSRFQLGETEDEEYSDRTERNVRDSDGTVIISASAELSGGTAETAKFVKQFAKPLLQLISSAKADEAALELGHFINQYGIEVLNVAGPRQSEEPGIGEFVKEVLTQALKPGR